MLLVLILRAFMKPQAQFSQFVTCKTSLTVNRYFRLMALATVEVMSTTPISAYDIYLNVAANPMEPRKDFANVHFN